MSRGQRILATVVALEAIALIVLSLARPRTLARPEVRTDSLDSETARDVNRLAQALRPERTEDWLRLAEVCRAFNLLSDAETCYRAVNHLEPEGFGHLFGWAVTLSRMGETQRAKQIFERAIAAGVPEADECRLMLARDRLREGDTAAAESALRGIKDSSPYAIVHWARLLVRTGRAAEALPELDRWLAANPDDLRARQLRGWGAEELGRPAEARVQRLLALRCRDTGPHMDSATAADAALRQRFGRERIIAQAREPETQGKWDRVIAILREANELSWRDHDAMRVANTLLAAGRPTEAATQIGKLMAVSGATGEHLLTLAQARLAAGDGPGALAAARHAEQLGANQAATGNLQVQQLLLNLAGREGDQAAARRHRGLVQFELGKISWLGNNVPQAHQQFLLTTRLLPEFAHAWFYLGETSLILGNPTAARQSYERCLQLAPNHGRALDALQRLR